ASLGVWYMASPSNATEPCGFPLQGFSEFPQLRHVLFLPLLAVHLVTLSGNLLILVAVASVPSRPPMLLFLCQLSAMELCYTLMVVPRALPDLAAPGLGSGSPSPSWPASSRLLVHFFCDITVLLHRACMRSYADELPLLGACLVLLLLTSLLILASYGAIAIILHHLRCPKGRHKATSTCASHLAVTLLHYGCITFMYVQPKASYSPRQDRTLALVYTNVTPLLYPLIHSLRNREITAATRQMLGQRRPGHTPAWPTCFMRTGNLTWGSEFVLLGFSSDGKTQAGLFILFEATYLLTLLGNGLIILLTGLDARLHLPMYFFLCNLSVVDICSISSGVPQMLVHFFLEKTISFA
ncbi:Olfactory Receptor 10Ac1, partial [Manis pentadactyla]